MAERGGKPSFGQRLKTRFYWVLGLVILLWALEIVNIATKGSLRHWGIIPRSQTQLWGIATAPFIHLNIPHLLSNTLPFLVLGSLVAVQGSGAFLGTSLLIILLGGAGVWLVGQPGTIHIGASGLIFGYFGFLLARALYVKSIGSILVALIVVALYGGMIFGVFPSHVHVSWEAHLFGLIAGFIAGRFQARPAAAKRR